MLVYLFQLSIVHNYLILSCLTFRTVYSGQRRLGTLFLINVFKGKINFHSIIDPVGICVPVRQIREFSAFSVNTVCA
jgi:hypothetical protein